MRTSLIAFLGLAIASTVSAAQKPPAKPDSKLTTLTLSGCVTRSSQAPDQFTLADNSDVYRLSGSNVGNYVGQRVEIVGRMHEPKVRIKTGLYPSPNVAAQAGAIDPARAATETSGTAAVGRGPLPEFRIQSIKTVAGNCMP
jgi:hypothetical protein